MLNKAQMVALYHERVNTTPKKVAFFAMMAALLVVVCAGLFRLLYVPSVDPKNVWYSRSYTTNNQIHPLFLPPTKNDTAQYDLLVVQNMGAKPLSVMAFSSRPRGASVEQTMVSWASWIVTTNYAFIVQPGYSYVLDPKDYDRPAMWHGNTWLAVPFQPGTGHKDAIPAATLPADYRAGIQVTYCRSQIPESWFLAPQMHATEMRAILAAEIDSAKKVTVTLDPVDLSPFNGLTAEELR